MLSLFNAKSNKQKPSLECLFKKHKVASGKVSVNRISYWEKHKEIWVCFDVFADDAKHEFSTSVAFTHDGNAVLDAAFDKIHDSLDHWLGTVKQFEALEASLTGKVILVWNAPKEETTSS